MIPTAPPTKDNPNPKHIDPQWLLQKLAEQDALTGGPEPLEPGMTPERLKERIGQKLRARGIDPNTIRYEQKYEDE